MKGKKQYLLLNKIWWICKNSFFIILGDFLLFRTFDLVLSQDHGIENMSAVAAVLIGSKLILGLFSFWYFVIMAGVGLVCMDQWEHDFEKKLFPIKNRIINWFYVPELIYLVFLVICIYDFLWMGVLAMLCYTVANYLSAIWFNNSYNAYQGKNSVSISIKSIDC